MEPQAIGENTPLLPATEARGRNPRNVTFSQDPVTQRFEPSSYSSRTSSSSNAAVTVGGRTGPPVLTALNNKLRRRNSHAGGLPTTIPPPMGPKMGAQRSTKKTEKLKFLPNPDVDEDEDEESGRDVYSQYTRIKDPTARRDAARLGKGDRDRLPRVTAYCLASRYELEGLMRFFKGRGRIRGANPKMIDECIYTPYSYGRERAGSGGARKPAMRYERRHSTGSESMEEEARRQHIMSMETERQDPGYGGDHFSESAVLDEEPPLGPSLPGEETAVEDGMPQDFDTHVHTPEVFIFDYGVVVTWGMSEAQEAKFLKEVAKFEVEPLEADTVETELFNFYYTREYQARIYNDFITLRDKGNYMVKLAISHALAQSVKTSLFEELIAATVDKCKDMPNQMAKEGKIALNRRAIHKQIGELFILRISIHLNGSVLDTPEVFWVEPQLEPVYQAVRSYLEVDQRLAVISSRVDVIGDLLAMLKDQLSSGHGEWLEWIVVILIFMEIMVALLNIIIDIYAGEF